MSAGNPAAPEPAEIAGRFQVVHKLGAGAFGTVYKAKDKVLGRMLAIKTIRLEGLAASKAGLGEMLDRFKREAQVAAQLKHPNIVTIYDIGEAEGLSYLSMELIDGVGLDRVIAETGRLEVGRAAALAAQVADALDYAHRHGVVHRDIKPANIMIEPGDRVKVTDFGIAKVTDSAEHLTMTGSLLGTPSYMSPEQARGLALDGRSDLFSLGCVLYEMVAGSKAFRGESITALLFKIITEEPAPVRELEPAVPEAMAQIIVKALAKAPEARYKTGREIADALLPLTRPGSMPTLRASEAPTLPPGGSGALPTLASPPTAQATQSSAPTLARGSQTSSTRPAGAAPLPPTILTPAAPTTVLPPSASAPAPPLPAARPGAAHPARPAPAAAARRGGGLGVVLGLGAAGLFVLAVVGLGAWLLLRRAPGPEPSPSPQAELALSPDPAASQAAPSESAPVQRPDQLVAEATPAPNAVGGHPVASTRLPPAATDTRAVATPSRETPSAGVDAGTPASGSGDFAFLDEVPAEGPDGRASGEALAQKYRGGGSTGLANTRFARRSRFPRNVGPGERAAVGTLAHLLFAQEAYQKANGRYATLHELKAAGLLHLDVPFAGGVFQRARYRFQLSGGQDEFKVTATPLGLGGRPFVVDDSGFVRVDE